MSSYTSFTNFNFGGISRKDSRFSQDLITCSDCQNVELYYTELNSGVGIRTVKGNKNIFPYKTEKVFNREAFTVVGTPTITDDGIASGFDDNNYIKTPVLKLGKTTKISIKAKKEAPEIGPKALFSITDGSGVQCRFYFNNNTGIIDYVCGGVYGILGCPIKSKDYFIFNMEVNSTSFVFSCLQNGQEIRIGNPKRDRSYIKLFSTSDTFTIELNKGFPSSNSSFDLKQFSISVDDKEVFSGIKEVVTSGFPQNEKVIGMFESHQDKEVYHLIYTESETEGKIYNFIEDKVHGISTIEIIKSGLQVTSKCCATDFVQGYLDMFIFSNGKDIVYIYSNTETHDKLVVESPEHIKLIDTQGRNISGLGMKVFDSRLFIFNGRTLWYSKQLECRDFQTSSPDDITSAGYIEYVQPITAIYPYLDSLAVFHSDSSSLLETDGKGKFVKTEESPGGCASYDSLVFHGTDLFFYDDTKKGVFSFKQIVNGDKTLGDNIAYDIQKELTELKPNQLSNIRSLSVVTEDRNEVWLLLPIEKDKSHSMVFIFDYIRGAWIKRKCQHINCISVINSDLYSGGNSIYKEYEGTLFDGEYIPHFYICTIFNLGADNTMKITKFPPRLTVDDAVNTHFWVQYIKNYNVLKDPKRKELKAKGYGSVFYYDRGMTYDSGNTYAVGGMDGIVRMPSATFKSLEIKFYTNEKDQAFSIKNIEMSKIKIKQV